MQLNKANYVPILSLKPAEMAAVEELFENEKDLILPIVELKRWANSNQISNSIKRVEKAFGNRFWIADLDAEFIESIPEKISESEGNVKEVFYQFQRLADPSNGYQNWVEFITQNINLIPVLQIKNVDELNLQLDNFLHLQRPIVARLKLTENNSITPEELNIIIKALSVKPIHELLVILDYGDLSRRNLLEYHQYSRFIKSLYKILPHAIFTVSGTSFPYSFGRSYKGEIPIYERQIYNLVANDCPEVKLVYSDRGSSRELTQNGGGGLPPPRIDYALKNDWRFVRKEFSEDEDNKEQLYKEAAIEIMKSDYWISNLPAWGRQMIEKTSIGDTFGITSAHRATAVRINLHLYQQLHYLENLNEIVTEEDWID
ncbi:beta family protein [Shewanella baltica]|uniref:beta family protein n=1 Tax=Shewanella baltica TaxID=62322 RepID=UPI0039B089BB